LQDPRAGAIAKDAFLLTVLKADGTPLVPNTTKQFDCLQTTGNFCPSSAMAVPRNKDSQDTYGLQTNSAVALWVPTGSAHKRRLLS
jgi:hypothetical protein